MLLYYIIFGTPEGKSRKGMYVCIIIIKKLNTPWGPRIRPAGRRSNSQPVV